MRAYPLAKRLAVLAACDAGLGTTRVAREHGCSESWVRRVKQRRDSPQPAYRFIRGRRRAPRWLAYQEQIETLMDNNPEMTIRELKEALGADLSMATLGRALQCLGWTKNRPRRSTEVFSF